MKTTKRIILIVLLIILAIVVALGVWQRENITSLVNSLRFSEEEIAKQLGDNQETLKKIAEETEYIDIRKDGGLTPEEEAALAAGEITEAEAVKIIRGQTTLADIKAEKEGQVQKPVQNTESAKPPQSSETKPAKPNKQETMTDEVSNIIAELYVVQSDFLSRLEGVGANAVAEFRASGKSKSEAAPFIEKYISIAGGLESTCDAKVSEILARLETALKKGGGDLALVDEVRQYYYKEKGLKKTYYMNKFLK